MRDEARLDEPYNEKGLRDRKEKAQSSKSPKFADIDSSTITAGYQQAEMAYLLLQQLVLLSLVAKLVCAHNGTGRANEGEPSNHSGSLGNSPEGPDQAGDDKSSATGQVAHHNLLGNPVHGDQCEEEKMQ